MSKSTNCTLALLVALSWACWAEERPMAGSAILPKAPEMARIPGGGFQMGAPSGEKDSADDERPVHTVQLKAFSLGRYEVTVAEFAAFVDDTGYQAGSACWTYEGAPATVEERAGRNWRNPAFSHSGKHPVVCVSWEDANAYIRWLNSKTGQRYRLPTEAEWEYAAKAGTSTARFWGNEESLACRYANVADHSTVRQSNWHVDDPFACDDGTPHTGFVGAYRPNAFGLYDMLGNVWEWTCSGYTERYDGTESSCAVSAGYRVYRGGSWGNEPDLVRAALRGREDAATRDSGIGFRLAHD